MSQSADVLVAEYIALDDKLTAAQKAIDEKLKPWKARQEEIKNLLLAMLNEQGAENIKTEHGTAYKSIIVTPKATDKLKYLDWVLEDWDKRGDMLQLGAPQKAALQEYMDDHGGQLPPYIETSSFTRINIRRS